MGDASDMADVERFMRSTEGSRFLEEFARELRGQKIENVEFSNETHQVSVVLHLENGHSVEMSCNELDLDRIRDAFEGALEREYYIDYPERRPAYE